MFAVITDYLGGMKVAKSYGLELHYTRHFRQATGRLVQQVLDFTRTNAATRLLWAQEGRDEEELWEVLRMAAAADFVSRLPQGLDTVVGDQGVRLSGGERLRLAERIIVLEQGRVAVAGTWEQLASQPGLVRNYASRLEPES